MSNSESFRGTARSAARTTKVFDSAVDEARKAVHEPAPVRNVFISFHIEDEAQVNLFRSQARDEDFGMEFRDYSVKEPFDEEWKRNCAERISQTSMTVCMIGPDTASRPAVIWELEESYRQGKKVIGVKIYRDRNDPIPEPLKRHNAPVVNWSRDEINEYLKRD
jgi:hypothetical protein